MARGTSAPTASRSFNARTLGRRTTEAKARAGWTGTRVTTGTAQAGATLVPGDKTSSSPVGLTWSGLVGQRGDDGGARLVKCRALHVAQLVEDQPAHGCHVPRCRRGDRLGACGGELDEGAAPVSRALVAGD